eukprot:g2628.t1
MTTKVYPPFVSEDVRKEAKEIWVEPVHYFRTILIKPEIVFQKDAAIDVKRIDVEEGAEEKEEEEAKEEEEEEEEEEETKRGRKASSHHESTDHGHKSRRPSMDGYDVLFDNPDSKHKDEGGNERRDSSDDEVEEPLPPGISSFPPEARHPSIHNGRLLLLPTNENDESVSGEDESTRIYVKDDLAPRTTTSSNYEPVDEEIARRVTAVASRVAIEASTFACSRTVDAITFFAGGTRLVEDEEDIGAIRRHLASILGSIEAERKRTRRLNAARSGDMPRSIDKLRPRVVCIEMARDRVLQILRRRKRRAFEKQGHLLQQLYGRCLQDPACSDRQRRDLGLAVVSNLSKRTEVRRDGFADKHRKSVKEIHDDFLERMDHYVAPLLPFKDNWDVASWMQCSSLHLEERCRILRWMDETKAVGREDVDIAPGGGRSDRSIDKSHERAS